MKRWSWWPVHFVFLLCSMFWVQGCIRMQPNVKLPPRSAPFQARKAAYQDLKAVVIRRTIYASRSTIRVTNRVQLNNGIVVYDPRALAEIVGDNTRTARFANKFEELKSRQRMMFWTSFGIALAGTAVTLTALYNPDEYRPPVVESPLFWTGIAVTGIASLAMGLASPIFGIPAARYQRRAFRSYNGDLRRRLGLRIVPRYRYRDNIGGGGNNGGGGNQRPDEGPPPDQSNDPPPQDNSPAPQKITR